MGEKTVYTDDKIRQSRRQCIRCDRWMNMTVMRLAHVTERDGFIKHQCKNIVECDHFIEMREGGFKT